VLPGLAHELKQPTTVFGLQSYTTLQTYWHFTLVICTSCARTETFTNNGPDLQNGVPGASLVQSSG